MISSERVALLGGLASDGDGVTETTVQRLATACAHLSGGWHAAIEVRQPDQASSLRGMSSALAEAVADLAFTAGQGPAWDALVDQRPVFVAEVGADPRWPQTGPALARAGVGCVAALPLQVGAITLGTLTLFHDRVVSFDRADLAELLELASALTDVLLDRLTGGGGTLAARIGVAAVSTAVVHQATGMVAVQLDCDLADALARVRGHAYRHGLPLTEVASAVVTGTVQLTP